MLHTEPIPITNPDGLPITTTVTERIHVTAAIRKLISIPVTIRKHIPNSNPNSNTYTHASPIAINNKRKLKSRNCKHKRPGANAPGFLIFSSVRARRSHRLCPPRLRSARPSTSSG